MFCTRSTPDFSVAEHYGLRNTTCLYSEDVASGLQCTVYTVHIEANESSLLNLQSVVNTELATITNFIIVDHSKNDARIKPHLKHVM
jgi:hypothetical protein